MMGWPPPFTLCARREHENGHPKDSNNGTGDVLNMRADIINQPKPCQRGSDRHPAIGGIRAPGVGGTERVLLNKKNPGCCG